MSNNWKIEVRGGSQIADTGDYSDPIYVLTNDDIELITKDEIDEADQIGVVVWMNQMGAKWEDWKLSDKEFEVHLKQQEVDRWKEIAGKLARELGTWGNPAHDQYPIEVLKNMP